MNEDFKNIPGFIGLSESIKDFVSVNKMIQDKIEVADYSNTANLKAIDGMLNTQINGLIASLTAITGVLNTLAEPIANIAGLNGEKLSNQVKEMVDKINEHTTAIKKIQEYIDDKTG